MAGSVVLKAQGLVTSPNQLELPPGSLTEASNVVIKRDNVIEPRRGYKLYGNSLGTSTDRAKQLMVYKDRILRHYTTILEFDDGSGQFTAFNGSYSEAQTGLRIKFIESNSNLYFTTSEGIKKISAASASDFSTASGYITQAGGVKAIDLTTKLNITSGSQTGFLPQDSAVAYRIVWGITDANNNLILGTPSQRSEIYNPLLSLLIQDYMNLLLALDNTSNNTATSLISDANYINTLKVDNSTSASTLRTNLLLLTTKIDEDILYANDSGSGAPLNIDATACSITAGVATITFSAGDPQDYLVSGSKIFLSGFTPASGVVNGAQTVASVTSTTLTFVTSATGSITVAANATIVSNEYRSITQPGTPSTPATNAELVDIQDYIDEIITRLQSEPSTGTPPTISSDSQTNFISPLDITTTATVILTITIPDEVTANHFYQIYRSDIAIAEGTAVLSTDVFPNDEMKLVYEAFPTSTEISAGTVTVEDITPDIFRGANLYTNPTTGEGILQANDVPPFALDINKFKNVVFYANTRTRHKKSLNLLGVVNMVNDYGSGLNSKTFTSGDVNTSSETITITSHGFTNGQSVVFSNTTPANLPGGLTQNITYYILNPTTNTFQVSATVNGSAIDLTSGGTGTHTVQNQLPKITFTNGSTTNTYSFVTGRQEVSKVYFGSDPSAANTLASSGTSSYFTINSGNNETLHYVWYQVGTSTDPLLTGRIGHKLSLTTETNEVVANRTRDLINSIVNDFTAITFSGSITDISVANPTVVTSANHGLETGDQIFVSGSDSTPAIDGLQTVTVIDTNTFTVPVNVTVQGTTGSWVSNKVKITNVASGYTTDIAASGTGLTVGVITQGRGEDASNKEILLSSNVSPAIAVDETARSMVRVINKTNPETVYAYYLSGAQDVPGKMLIESKTLSESPFYILGNNTVTGESFNPDISPTIAITSNTLANPTVVTTSSPHGLINQDQVVIVGSNSTPSIDGLYTITFINSTSFSIPVNVSSAGTSGALISAVDAVFSDNEELRNRIYYSKVLQPEAVPIINTIDVGAKDAAILRIFPLRDSLFVFKEDGLFRISGESAPFNLALFDGTCTLKASDSVSAVNNLIFCWTDQGIVSLSENGISSPPVSRPIDETVLKLASSDYTNFSTATWGIGYESDNSYIVYTIDETTDSVAQTGYRYSTLTNSWTIFDKPATCGITHPVDDKQYLGAGNTNFLEQERKSFTRLDYADREVEKTLAFGNYYDTEIQFDDIVDVEIGDVFTQNQTLTVFSFNALLQKLDNDPFLSPHDYESSQLAVAGDNMRTKLDDLIDKIANDPGRATHTGFLPASDYEQYKTISGTLTITSISADNPTVITTSTSHNLQTGRIVSISGSNSSPSVNGTHSITVTGANTFTIPISVVTVGTAGSVVVENEDFDDIETSFNGLINTLNNDPGVIFSNYMLIEGDTLQEAIVVGTNSANKRVEFNLELPFIVGPMTHYKRIVSRIQWSPQTFGDPLSLKHVREAQVLFENKAFTNAMLSFASDLLPAFIDIPFDGTSNGIFGFNDFGYNFFGGVSHAAPFRTYIPRNVQRCRYLIPKFMHQGAREKYSIYGLTLTSNDNSSSTRSYR